MPTSTTSSLQSLLSGEPMPQYPLFQKEWDLTRYQKEMEDFHRKLMNYIRRLVGRLTSVNIINEISVDGVDSVPITAWRYDNATNKFQIKTQSVKVLSKAAESAWTDVADGVQPSQVTELNAWHYDTSAHKFQVKTQSFFVLSPGSVSSYSNTADGQPTVMSNVQIDTNYSTTTHILSKDRTADVYVLEKGSTVTGTNIDTSVPCS